MDVYVGGGWRGQKRRGGLVRRGGGVPMNTHLALTLGRPV